MPKFFHWISCVGPPAKKCKGCGTGVVNPVTCAHCGVVSHPGCIGRTGHPCVNGLFLNCGLSSSSGSAVVDVDVTDSQLVQAQPSFPTVDMLKDMMSEIRLLREEFGNFRQEIVSTIREELADLKSNVSDLDKRVRLLEQNAASGTGQLSLGPLATDEIMAELKDRQARAGNLIIHGLPESPSFSPDISRSEDLVAVKSILNQIRPSDYVDITLLRLGKRRSSAPRPLCVGLKSPDVVISVLRRKSRYVGPCKITDDRTRTQRQALDQLRGRLKELHERGEMNWTIRYNHGVPSIVATNRTRDPASKNH